MMGGPSCPFTPPPPVHTAAARSHHRPPPLHTAARRPFTPPPPLHTAARHPFPLPARVRPDLPNSSLSSSPASQPRPASRAPTSQPVHSASLRGMVLSVCPRVLCSPSGRGDRQCPRAGRGGSTQPPRAPPRRFVLPHGSIERGREGLGWLGRTPICRKLGPSLSAASTVVSSARLL